MECGHCQYKAAWGRFPFGCTGTKHVKSLGFKLKF